MADDPKELPIYNPLVVERTERDGVPHSETSVVAPRLTLIKPTDAVLAALETRAMLIAAEKACEEIGAKLSGQIREFSGNELIAYSEATRERSDEV